MSKMTPKQKEMYFRLSYDYWMDWKTKPDAENISGGKKNYEVSKLGLVDYLIICFSVFS